MENNFVPLTAGYDSQRNIVESIVGGALATTTDIGTTVFNSLMPERFEVDTRDVLSRLSDNALNVYDENQDTIKSLSFMGGLVVPAGITIKGMKMLRDGTKGMSWFSTQGKVDQMKQMETLLLEGQRKTAQFKELNRAVYMRNFVNDVVVDNVAMEVALITTMNAHPFMEDYMKDPVKGFTNGMFLGGAIVTPISLIGSAFATKGLIRNAYATVSGLVKTVTREAEAGEGSVDTILRMSDNLERMGDLVTTVTPLNATRSWNKLDLDYLDSYRQTTEAEMLRVFDNMASSELKALEDYKLVREKYIGMMRDDPLSWRGAESIGFVTSAKEIQSIKKVGGIFPASTDAVSGPIPFTTSTKKGKINPAAVVYSPRFEGFFSAKDLDFYGTAADLGVSLKSLVKGISSNFHKSANTDNWFGLLGSTTARADAAYLATTQKFMEMDAKAFKEAVIDPQDIPTLQAFYVAARERGITDVKVAITAQTPNFAKVQQLQIAQLPSIKAKVQAGNVGAPSNYLDALKDISSRLRGWQVDYNPRFSPLARKMIRGWVAGPGMRDLRDAAEDYFRARFSSYVSERTTKEQQNVIKEIYESQESKELREAFRKVQDSEGYVYLFRGLKTDPMGSSAIESYSVRGGTAHGFSGGKGAKTFRIKVDDILGVAHKGEDEVMVLSHTAKTTDGVPLATIALEVPPSLYTLIPKTLKYAYKEDAKTVITNAYYDFMHTAGNVDASKAEAFVKASLDDYLKDVKEYEEILTQAGTITTADIRVTTLPEVLNAMSDAKATLAEVAKKEGWAVETLAIKGNMPLESAEILMSAANIKEAARLVPLIEHNSPALLETALSYENRGIRLGTSKDRIPMALARSQAMQRNLLDAEKIAIDSFFSSSLSQQAKGIHTTLTGDVYKDVVKWVADNLHSISPDSIGNRFFQSADSAVKALGDIGDSVVEIGKRSGKFYRDTTNELLTPIAKSFTELAKSDALIYEFNYLREEVAGLSGYKELRGNKFFIQDADTPWVLGADGKPIRDPAGNKVRNMIPATDSKGNALEIKDTKVQAAFEEGAKIGRELYEWANTNRKILGSALLRDTGFWLPPMNPRDKIVNYAINQSTQETMLLFGKTTEELEQAKKLFQGTIPADEAPQWKFVAPGLDQAEFNRIAARHDPVFMQSANIDSFHKGTSKSAVVRVNSDLFKELTNAYEHYIHRQVQTTLEIEMAPIVQYFDRLSTIAQKGYQGQNLSLYKKFAERPKDSGGQLREILLGLSGLPRYEEYKMLQEAGSAIFEGALNTVRAVFNSAKEGKYEADYLKMSAELEAKGIPNMFEAYAKALPPERGSTPAELFGAQRAPVGDKALPQLIALSSQAAATLMLKVGELGQALVNAISLPILTTGAIGNTLKASYMGASLNPSYRHVVNKSMMEGVRYLGNPEYLNVYRKIGKDLGVMDPIVSEVTELAAKLRSSDPGVAAKAEALMNSRMVELLSIGTTTSEKLVREIAFATGVKIAREAYPTLGKGGVITYARNFVDQAIGNFDPLQRPILFQGNLGIAMGLFQTYMVTMAQQIFHKIGNREFKALSKMMLAQGTIFGAKALPGFNQVSEYIGEHFSDQNYDLTTGTYRAINDDLADFMLYGFPSALGPAIYSRGDLQPRIPSGLDNLAAVNIAKSAFASADRILDAARNIGDEGAMQALAEALTVQHISRPLARLSELYTGYGITNQGSIMAGPEEVRSVQGALARVFAVRGIREAKAREAEHLNSFYGALDRENRQSAIRDLRTHIRAGTLDAETTENILEKYMRTGTDTGWRSIMSKAMADTDSPGVSAVRNHLRPDSPYNLMVEESF